MQVRLEGRAFVPQSPASNPVPRSFSMFNPPIEALASITEEDFKRVFRDSPVKRAKYRGWLRNICVLRWETPATHDLSPNWKTSLDILTPSSASTLSGP